jgi:hypothetical protein
MLPLSTIWTVKTIWRCVEQIASTIAMPVFTIALMLREKSPALQCAAWAFHPCYPDGRYRNPFVFTRQAPRLTRAVRLTLLSFGLQVNYSHVF